MTSIEQTTIEITRRIDAPPGVLFAILADPTTHPGLDGSGMVRGAQSSDAVQAVGDVFTMEMFNDRMGDYEMANRVVVFEPDRQIAWQPVLAKAGRPEDEDGVGKSAHQVWGFQLVPAGPSATDVTEFFDCTESPDWLRNAVEGGERWRDSINITLEKLAALADERLTVAN